MIIDKSGEMSVFWTMFLVGQLICVVFDFFRALRKHIGNHPIGVAFEDTLFCFMAFRIFFDAIYHVNDGAFRWYVFASVILSCVLYFTAESMYVLKIWDKILICTGKILHPFLKLAALIKRMFVLCRNWLRGLRYAILRRFRQKTTKKPLNLHENNDVF